jgi:microcystin-dependent protein
MTNPYVGEIRMFAGNFAPANWSLCDGSLINIAQNEALFNLIGTTYGGDGINTFALPDLRSRAPLHVGTDKFGDTFVMGMMAGVENVVLQSNQIGAHSHTVAAVNTGSGVASPVGALPGVSTSGQQGTTQYGTGATSMTSFVGSSVGLAGESQPHGNVQPTLAITFIIALYGIYPSPN